MCTEKTGMKIPVKNSILLAALAAILAASGCSSSKSPAPPPTEEPLEEAPIDTDFDDDSGELTPSGASYDFGGADIGDDETKREVQDCHDDGNVYDRFSGDAGKCGKLQLAAIDCTLKALRGLLTDKQKTQFNDSLAGKYSGYEIDQCGDCEKDSDQKACDPGDSKEGMIVFFVKEVNEEEEIAGLTMFLPHRKAHDTAASNSNTSTIGDDDDDATADEVDGGADTESTDAS